MWLLKRPKLCTTTYTIGMKFWLSKNGGCTTTHIDGREKRRVKGRLKMCGVMDHDDSINDTIKVVSFDDTLGKSRR